MNKFIRVGNFVNSLIREARQHQPVRVGIPRNKEDFAHFAGQMAALNPNGFRKPGKDPRDMSFVEAAAAAAGHIERPGPLLPRSKRGQRKEAARLELLAAREKLRAEGGIADKYRNSYRRRMDARFGRLVVT